ncbi:dienelactone hydrolase family protein [candidate division KSB1 bacterium]|nr:dienelactone hydrolase family protein [candidate division KSB1 bacterium]
MRVTFALIMALALANVSAQDFAKQRLEKSSRHQEWVAVKHGERTVHAFLVFPEVKNKTLAVVVIHENRGLTDWVRSVADQLAEAGYIAIAPDLLSGTAPNGGKTSDFPSGDAAREAISNLPPDQVTADLNAAADYVAKLPACNGKVAVAGFCWGGRQSFRFATNRPDLKAAFVFYGTGPESKDDFVKIKCPVYGFYGGNDARVNATIPQSAEFMTTAAKIFEPITYDGAGHGFMRSGEDPNAAEANKQARDQAWSRWQELLKKL